MTERELFDAIGRLPEQYRTEALTPDKKQPEKQQPNEIDALFDSASHAEAVQYRTEPVQKTIHGAAGAVRRADSQKPRKSGVPGLTAIAAAVALTVGIFAWKMRQDSEIGRTPASKNSTAANADFVQERDISAEPVTELPGDPADSGTDSAAQQEDSGTASKESQTDTPQSDAVNVFGGHGKLKPVMHNGTEVILEDDDYWYVNGVKRVSKTARNDQGHLYGELLCQTAGCAHTDVGCMYYSYRGKLLSDGKEIYHVHNDEIPGGESGNSIDRLNENGEWELLFKLNGDPGGINAALSAQYHLQHPENSDTVIMNRSQICYYGAKRLGDTSIYYISGIVYFSSNPNDNFYFGILIDEMKEMKPRFALLPYSGYEAQYDAEHDLLYLMGTDTQRHINNTAYVYDMKQIELSDSISGDLPQPVKILSSGNYINFSACCLDGKLYYLSNTGENAPGSRENINLLCFDPETGESTVLEEKTDKGSISAYGGRMYYSIQARVGMDKVCSCAPDLSDEQVIYETPNRLRNIYPVTDPSFIRIAGEMGDYFLVNGEALRVDNPDYV